MKIFEASQFTATEFSTAEDKAKFACHFVRFVESGFKETLFPKWFYTRLSMIFGHIAHYDIHGFYAEFFTCTKDKLRFLRACSHQIFGDPAYTFSDVEKALQDWMRRVSAVSMYEKMLLKETEKCERAELARLSAKYPDARTSQVRTCEFCRPVSNPFPSLGALEAHQQEAHGLVPS